MTIGRAAGLGLLAFAACTAAPPAADGGAVFDAGGPDAGAADGGWISLFDGQTLGGWTRYLGVPADGGAPLGADNDPRGVFSVATVDGEL